MQNRIHANKMVDLVFNHAGNVTILWEYGGRIYPIYLSKCKKAIQNLGDDNCNCFVEKGVERL